MGTRWSLHESTGNKPPVTLPCRSTFSFSDSFIWWLKLSGMWFQQNGSTFSRSAVNKEIDMDTGTWPPCLQAFPITSSKPPLLISNEGSLPFQLTRWPRLPAPFAKHCNGSILPQRFLPRTDSSVCGTPLSNDLGLA